MEEVITPGSKGGNGSAPIYNDQRQNTPLPHLLALSAGTWSQSTSNKEDKTTTLLDSAVSTGSCQGLGWAALQGYAPAAPLESPNTPPGQRLYSSNQCSGCLRGGAAEPCFKTSYIFVNDVSKEFLKRRTAFQTNTLQPWGLKTRSIMCSQATKGACSSLLVFRLVVHLLSAAEELALLAKTSV